MKTIIILLIYGFSLTIGSLQAQDVQDDEKLKFTGYQEVYYIYDFGRPDDHIRPDFITSFNRHNEVTLNLAYVKAAYQTDKIRANLALMTGTYPNANLSTEPGVLKNIFEANTGVKISKQHELWIDAGIFASHIGFESAIGASGWNLTRSILADNSPYYESGVKLSYTSANKDWFMSFLIINGWQRIQRLEGNNTPTIGHQLTFTPNEKVTLNSSSFIGSDTPDSLRQMRYFHNFYGQIQLTPKFGLIVGFDLGVQQESKESSSYNTWYSPVLIARYAATDMINVAVRGEYYSDEQQVIIATGTPNGFQTFGYSVNVDFQILESVIFRMEGRGFRSRDTVFMESGSPSDANFFLATSLSVSF